LESIKTQPTRPFSERIAHPQNAHIIKFGGSGKNHGDNIGGNEIADVTND
jgi:hypothetical protein